MGDLPALDQVIDDEIGRGEQVRRGSQRQGGFAAERAEVSPCGAIRSTSTSASERRPSIAAGDPFVPCWERNGDRAVGGDWRLR